MSEENILFVFYSINDRLWMKELSDALRERQIQVLWIPIENLNALKSMIPQFTSSKNKYLGVGISNSVLSSDVTSNSCFSSFLDQCNHLINLEPSIGRILLFFGEASSYGRVGQLRRTFGYGNPEVIIHDPLLQDGSPEKIVSIVGGLGKQKLPIDPTEGYFEIVGIFDPLQPMTKTYSQLFDQIKFGRIDQKYLYWDAPAALRWQEITDGTQYLTAPNSLNFLAARGNEIVKTFVKSVTDSERIDVSFINLGVGTGFKDAVILTNLLQNELVRSVCYFAVDDSLPMIQVTIPNIIKGFYSLSPEQRQRSALHYVITAFEKLDNRLVRYMKSVEESEGKRLANEENGKIQRVRLIGFLGGSLGNFQEDQILGIVRDRLMESKDDTLLLGTDFVANRKKDELIANYSDQWMKSFLFGPIQDVLGMHPPFDKFKYKVFPDDGLNDYSVVDDAKTIVGFVNINSHDVELFYASKYVPEKLEPWLKEQHFNIVGTPFTSLPSPSVIGKYLLKRSWGNKFESRRK